MKKVIFLFISFPLIFHLSLAQSLLQADGPGNTYELINSVLAPGYSVVEVPDCKHGSFGRHIDEVFDSTLNTFVFRFHIHTHDDDDRCINFDRQRNEIKTYGKSPDSLLGVKNEMVEYKWRFKLDAGFQPSSSFTHIHQIKAVGGSEDAMPLITLTCRKSSPDKLQLRYAESNTQITLKEVSLAPFKGAWVEATETIYYEERGLGRYEISIIRLSDSNVLFSYNNPAIRTWKTDASFLRPKWGIYRSLNDSSSLRDESIRFADIRIEELNPMVLSVEEDQLLQQQQFVFPNPFHEKLTITDQVFREYDEISIYDIQGKTVLSQQIMGQQIDFSFLQAGLYFIRFKNDEKVSKAVRILKK